MASEKKHIEDEISSWLKVVLKSEKLKEICVNFSGNAGKGTGYLGDILFVPVRGIREDGSSKNYDLVLKCSKKSKALRENTHVEEAFMTEIFTCEKVLPTFIQFQKDKGIDDIFDSVPKCYGSYIGEDLEVLVLENLKKLGYEMWPQKLTVTKKHIDLVMKKYAQLHAVSVVMKDQAPEEFQKFVDFLSRKPNPKKQARNLDTLFGKPIQHSYDLLRGDLDEDILRKWRSLKEQLPDIFALRANTKSLNVIIHGDGWNNNYLYYHKDNNKEAPLKVSILDWQLARYGSPIIDISYFIFCCTSIDEENIDEILLTYHNFFEDHLKKLGVANPETVYPVEQLLNDWKSYSKFGIMSSAVVTRMVCVQEDEVLNLEEIIESGKNFGDAFVPEIRDVETYKRRIKPIIEYVVKHNLI